MKVIKCINNNVAICLDSKNRELVAFGKGIGFRKAPYEIPLSQIERTFYNIDYSLLTMVEGLDENIVSLSTKIVDYACNIIDSPFSPNIVFSLADHIDFAIKRHKDNMNISLPVIYDVQYLFEKEYRVGEYALKLIQDEMKLYLPKEEAGYIAVHFVNAEAQNNNEELPAEKLIEDITQIIENNLNITIDKDGANYARFATHMRYLLKRGDKQSQHETENIKMYNSLVEQYPQISDCVEEISKHFLKELDITLNEEEKLYLILHVNRLLVREETN